MKVDTSHWHLRGNYPYNCKYKLRYHRISQKKLSSIKIMHNWPKKGIPQIGAIHPQAKRCSTFSLKMPYPHTKRLCLPNGKTWSAACSTQLVGQERSPRDGFIPCASAPEAAGSAAAGALHDQRRGGGEAHCLDKLSCRELICIVFFSILCPFCLKSSKRLNKDIPLADSRLAPNCIYSVMAGQNDWDYYKCTNVMIRDPWASCGGESILFLEQVESSQDHDPKEHPKDGGHDVGVLLHLKSKQTTHWLSSSTIPTLSSPPSSTSSPIWSPSIKVSKRKGPA